MSTGGPGADSLVSPQGRRLKEQQEVAAAVIQRCYRKYKQVRAGSPDGGPQAPGAHAPPSLTPTTRPCQSPNSPSLSTS